MDFVKIIKNFYGFNLSFLMKLEEQFDVVMNKTWFGLFSLYPSRLLLIKNDDFSFV